MPLAVKVINHYRHRMQSKRATIKKDPGILPFVILKV